MYRSLLIYLFLAGATPMQIQAQPDDEYIGVVRQNLQQVQDDFLEAHAALESFHMDNGYFPESITNTRHMPHFTGAPAGTPSFKAAPHFLSQVTVQDASYNSLTSPTAYLTKLWLDPFATQTSSTYAYLGDAHGFLIWSPGPDRKYDIDVTDYDTTQKPSKAFAARYSYDPTNGALSNGDIFCGDGWPKGM